MEDVAEVVQIRENLSKWEDDNNPLAPLSSEERDSIIELTSGPSWRPTIVLYQKNTSNQTPLRETLGALTSHNETDLVDSIQSESTHYREKLFEHVDFKIESSQQFLNWYAGVEEGMEREQDGPYHEYVLQLENHRNECRTLLKQLNDALENLQKLSNQYTSVSTKTSALHTDCEHLLAEQTRLSNGADTIENKLAYFLEVNRISQKLSSPAFQVSSDGFIPLLGKIDECINYMNSNLNYKESSIYLAKYKQCLNRALSMIRSYVTRSLESTTNLVLPQPGAQKLNTNNALILYYGKFRTSAPKIKVLMTEVEDRLEANTEYSDLLSDCHQCYFAQRKILLEPCVSDAVNQLSQKYAKDYCSLVRSGCAFLVHVCEDEHNLYHQFFSVTSIELEKFVQDLCSLLYDALRPLIIHIDHLETLSELCNILRRGMIEEQIQNNPVQLAALTSVVNQLLEDCQERLVYRAHIYMQTDIAKFSPSPGDLAYPSKLEMMESIAESLVNQRKSLESHKRNDSVSSLVSVRSLTSEEVTSINATIDERFSRVGSSPADLHGMWYPTVRRTLMCLSKVYRSVDRSIFQGVSLEALAACMQSLSSAATSIAKLSSQLDAQLFEIKHLLILREQLAPFQVDASLREMTLDWSRLREAAFALVQKRNRLFSLTSNNALLEFIVEGTPQVTEQILDSKRNVDNQLKKVCEQLISTNSEMLISPLTAFVAKIEVILRMNGEEKDVKPILVKNQPFASPSKVADLITLTQKNLKSQIPLIQKRLRLYLANKDTEFILFKPIRTNVLAALTKVNKILQENYNEEERHIIGCPTQEEVSALISSLFET